MEIFGINQDGNQNVYGKKNNPLNFLQNLKLLPFNLNKVNDIDNVINNETIENELVDVVLEEEIQEEVYSYDSRDKYILDYIKNNVTNDDNQGKKIVVTQLGNNDNLQESNFNVAKYETKAFNFDDEIDFEKVKQETPKGEACTINGKLYYNSDNELIELNMTKETYEKLFPPSERNFMKQGQIGDCYLLSLLEACVNDNNAYGKLLQLFTEKDDGTIVVTLNNGTTCEFPNGELLDFDNYAEKSVKSCKGIQMLEQTYAVSRLNGWENNRYTNASRFVTQHLIEAGKKVAASGSKNAVSLIDDYYSILNEGYMTDASRDIFDTTSTETGSFERCMQNVNKDDCLCMFSTKHSKNYWLNEEFNLASGHAYTIVDYDSKTKQVSYVNPHDTSKVYTTNIDLIRNNISKYTITKFKE